MSEAVGSWRERITLTSTVKDGFRVGEVTVEFTETASIGGAMPREERRARIRQAIEDGQQVAEQMNQQSALAKTTNVTAPESK